MTTQPTNLPVPSESPRDLKFNAGKIDEFVTSASSFYLDRFGNEHYTIEGLSKLAQEAIAGFGYITLDSFEDGNTITLPNEVLRLEATGEYYRWDGPLPKIVPAGSTPESTGGVGKGKWLSVGDATLRSELGESTGASLIGVSAGGNLAQMLYWSTPEQFGAVGDGVADDTAAVKASIMTGRSVFRRGATYRMVMTEANVITPPAGAYIDFNGASITHESTGYLVFMNKNPDVTIINFNGIYKGSYPTTAVPTTRYGISRPHEAAFVGFIGMNGNAFRFSLINAKAVGFAAANKYDFLVSGYEGNFRDSLFSKIFCTHYACVLINNFAYCNIEYVSGTLRHDASFAVYGPSHLMYINCDSGSISHCIEFGSLLSNIYGGCNSTLQLTNGDGTVVTDLVCTMDDCPVLAAKVKCTGTVFDGIISRSNFTSTNPSGPIHLIQFLTNSESELFDITLSNVRLYLPANIGDVSGFLCGGTRTTVRNMVINIPLSTRTVEPLLLVTCAQADLDITMRNSVAGVPVLLSSFNNSIARIKCINNGVTVKSNNSIHPGWFWGENFGSTVTISHVPGSTSVSTFNVNAGTMDRCKLLANSGTDNEWISQAVGGSGDSSSVSLNVPLPNSAVNTETLAMYFYKVTCTAATTTGASGGYAEYAVMFRAGSSIQTTSRQLQFQQFNTSAALTMSLAANTSGTITATFTRSSGGEVIRDLYMTATRVNKAML